LVCYVLALGLLERYLGPRWRVRSIALSLVGLHALCAVAMYLGRFVRANSWDVVVDPGGIAAWSNELTHRFALAAIVAMFVVLMGAWFAMRAIVIEVLVDGKRVARRLHVLR